MNFANAVREARKKQGLSQEALADRAHVSIHAVWELEANGNGTMRLLDALCVALDLRFAGLPKGPTLAARVACLRERKSLTVNRLAERAGVSPGAVRRVETGTARIQTLVSVLTGLSSDIRVRQHERAIFAGGGRDERFTPADMANKIAAILGGEIELDPCGHPESPVPAMRRMDIEHDSLTLNWTARTVYCNPPFSQATAFIKKAHLEWREGRSKMIILLLPSRTNSITMHDLVFSDAHVLFPRGRMLFLSPEGDRRTIPYATLLAFFGADAHGVEAMKREFPGAYLPPKSHAMNSNTDAEVGPVGMKMAHQDLRRARHLRGNP